MAEVLDSITPELAEFCESQPVFFVATAPLAPDGHVNLSPKGHDSFRVVDEHTAAYVDLTGSGIETTAHLRENGRIVLMFCAFTGRPRIVRLYGLGESLALDSPEALPVVERVPEYRGARSLIRVRVDRVSTSCGYAVPLMELKGERHALLDWADKKDDAELADYRSMKNAESIDGLPGLP